MAMVLYAKKSLRGLDIFSNVKKNMDPREEHEIQVIVETIVSLLPKEKNTLSVSFLSILIRAAIYLDTTVSCRLALENRMSEQLGQAVLDGLLIPCHSIASNTLFDIDTVQRIITNLLENEIELNEKHVSSSPGAIERVTKLMESYLAKIASVASDHNLSVSKFTTLSALVPVHMRVNEDGMYRAIDIYLKAHPSLNNAERKQVCSVMDCQKLSREACAHAAQNDRLPVQTVVQVLFYEQQRLHDAADGGFPATSAMNSPNPVKAELSFLRRENYELKMELVKAKMKLNEIEKAPDKFSGNLSTMASSDEIGKPPVPKKSFFSAVSEKIGRFLGTDTTPRVKRHPSIQRRHSIS